MNKDEILTQIIKTEANLKDAKAEEEIVTAQGKETAKAVETHQKAYDLIKEQLDTIASALRDSKFRHQDHQQRYRDVRERQRDLASDLGKLKRELSRMEDAERIHAEYLAEVDAFREKCLLAPWRAENREDGIGAYEYQIDGAIHLAVAGQALLGDKRGLGKSLTSLIYADLKDAQKVVVISPSDTMDNFIREIKMWSPHRSVIKIGKMPKAQRDFILPTIADNAQFTIVLNYEAWRRDDQLVQDIINLRADTLIYDEAHKAKTWSSHISKGIQDIRFGLNICPECMADRPTITLKQLGPNSTDINTAVCSCGHESFVTDFCSIRNVLPMTGTPILNKPQEMFPHLRAIDPANFTDEKTFLVDFCHKNANNHWVWQWGGEERLIKRIGPRYLARDRKTAGVVIPPATPVEHVITQDEFKENYPQQWDAYQQIRQYAQLVLNPEEGIAMAMPYMITVLMRLRQCLVWPAGIVLKSKDKDGMEIIHARLNVHESVKLDKAQELISEITEEGEAVLGFSMFKDPLYELENRLGHRATSYTGDTNDWRKNQIQLEFDPKTTTRNRRWDVVLGTYGAMGQGLNMNVATHEVMLDRYWNPGGEDQAEGRIDRIGTTRDTYIHRIMVEGTVDSWMKSLIDEKANLIGGFSSQADLYQEVYRALRDGEI